MNKTRTALKWVAGTAVAAVLVVGSATSPAQAKDTGWNPICTPNATQGATPLRDTGWNPI